MHIPKSAAGKNHRSFLFSGILKGLDAIPPDPKEETNTFYYVCKAQKLLLGLTLLKCLIC